jgi:DNA-binding transcriptional MerR regulator
MGTVSNERLAAPPKRYRVGELAEHFGLTRQTLHNWARWGLIREAKWSAGGHRLFDESAFERVAKILELKRSHRLDEVRALLAHEDAA